MDKLRRDRVGSLPMRSAFPAVRALRISLAFDESQPNRPANQMLELHPAARAFFTYPCPYANCDGQFDLDGPVKEAIGGGAPSKRGLLECTGLRARTHATKEACRLQLHYEVRPLY